MPPNFFFKFKIYLNCLLLSITMAGKYVRFKNVTVLVSTEIGGGLTNAIPNPSRVWASEHQNQLWQSHKQ